MGSWVDRYYEQSSTAMSKWNLNPIEKDLVLLGLGWKVNASGNLSKYITPSNKVIIEGDAIYLNAELIPLENLIALTEQIKLIKE